MATAFFFAGAFLPAMTASLNAFSGVIFAAFLAGTFTVAPVCGLRARRGPRCTRRNFAKPVSTTSSPVATVSVIVMMNSSTKATACFLSMSSRSASSAASSRLFTLFSLIPDGHHRWWHVTTGEFIVAHSPTRIAAITQKNQKSSARLCRPSRRRSPSGNTHPAKMTQRVKTILPNWSPWSISAKPECASASGLTESITGRTPVISTIETSRWSSPRVPIVEPITER